MASDNMGFEPGDFQVALPPDSTGKGIHLVEVTLTDTAGNPFTAYQEVVTLADSDGNPVAVTSQGRPRLLVTSPTMAETLREIVAELQDIKAVLLAGLRPDGHWNDLPDANATLANR